MSDNEYPNNSYHTRIGLSKDTAQKKPKEIVPIASGTEKKRTIIEQIADNFIATNFEEMKRSLIFDWLIPGGKNIIEAMVHMILFGNGSPSSSSIRPKIGLGNSESRLRRIDIYHNGSSNEPYIPSRVSREPEIVYQNKEQADAVISELRKCISECGRVTVKELYTLSNISQTDWGMTNWGWRYIPEDLKPFQVRGGGWCIKMPRTEEMR